MFFDHKYTKDKAIQIREQIRNGEQLQNEANELLEHVFRNAITFDGELSKYRQRLVSCKYKTHRKLVEMARGARECLTQTLLALYEAVLSRHRAFKNMLRQSIRESSLLQKVKRRGNVRQEESADKLAEIIISVTQEYNDLIGVIESSYQALEGGLALMGTRIDDRRVTAKQIVEELNRVYEQDENPTP